MTNNDRPRVCVRKQLENEHWIASETVRKEASRLAIQHQYFDPGWFAEFKDYLHNGSSPFHARLLKELCLIVAGSEACRYCVKRKQERCSLTSER